MIELQKQGKVKDIGVSNFMLHHMEHLFKNSDVKPVIN
jgi:diketogulonate reductase-like aldo/keto reductase